MGKSEAKFGANLFASNGDMELYKLREVIRIGGKGFETYDTKWDSCKCEYIYI